MSRRSPPGPSRVVERGTGGRSGRHRRDRRLGLAPARGTPGTGATAGVGVSAGGAADSIPVPEVEVEDPDGDARVLVLGWGSTYGPI
ncbi:hypothetical protein, partial [Micromonospora sp. NPDC049799]|uniref:hypothetical protein n=1 Tax=Micromonospora sp. NPDC049799 TaxID=3154741 RepID=UPI00340CAEAE